MIKLVAGYRQVTEEGRKLEFATSAKLKFELSSDYKTQTIYQDINCNLYAYSQLAGNRVVFMDGTSMNLETTNAKEKII